MQSLSARASNSKNDFVTCHDITSSVADLPRDVPSLGAHASGRSGGVGPGLVHSPTSDPSTSHTIAIDRSASRLKRLKSSVLTASRLHCQTKPKWRVVMITPTYAPSNSWDSRDITGLVKHIRKWLARKGIEMRYVWVLEYTKKGAPHYHMLVWLPLGITLPYPDKRGWWTKGWTNQEWARNAIGYIAKYASKGSDLVQYVRGARHHGNGGLDGEALLEQRWWKLPSWIRGSVTPADCVRRNPGGGVLLPATGEIFASPWEVFFQHGQVFIRLKTEFAS